MIINTARRRVGRGLREACELFSSEELSQLTFRVVAINGWNRMNVAFRSAPGSQDKAFGLDKAGLN
jgi:alkylhydroperoxidase family enzyme